MEMEKITTFKQIKEIIEPIPADQFCVDVYENLRGQCCFLGHIQKYISGDACIDSEGFGARQLTRTFLLEVHYINADGSTVNRNTVNCYTEPIIKDRLMHMIEDGIKWEESKSVGAFPFTILKKLQRVGFSFFKFKILEKNIQHEWRKHGVIFSVGGSVGEWPLKAGHVRSSAGWPPRGRQLRDNDPSVCVR